MDLGKANENLPERTPRPRCREEHLWFMGRGQNVNSSRSLGEGDPALVDDGGPRTSAEDVPADAVPAGEPEPGVEPARGTALPRSGLELTGEERRTRFPEMDAAAGEEAVKTGNDHRRSRTFYGPSRQGGSRV